MMKMMTLAQMSMSAAQESAPKHRTIVLVSLLAQSHCSLLTKPASSNAAPAKRIADASGSDDDVYGGARGKEFAKRHRRLQAASGRDTPTHAEVRFSTRRAAKVSNYNEDGEDMFEESDTENMTPNYWVTAQEDVGPAIDVVLHHRLQEGKDYATADKHDYEFYIKWQDKSHYHATWEPWSALTSYRGFRRLENYFRKVVREEQYIKTDPDISLEEKERWILEMEARLDALEDYTKVERVIGAREGEEEIEYYVKWRGLTYDNSTWETASLVSDLAQDEIDRYLDRTSKLPVSDKRESNPATRRPYKPFRTQPDYIKFGQLREFQMTGVNFLAHNWANSNNVVLADEMGLGKTVQTVSFINWLRHDRGQEGPFLIIVPLSTMPAWADTFNKWTPDINYVIYNGNEASRRIIQDYELLVDGNPRKVKFNVLLTTYEYILLDNGFLSQLKWQFMGIDEAHRLKNKESQLYIKLMEFGVPSRLLITGTPLQNNLTELSSLMNFLMPGMVSIEEDIDLASDTAKQKLDELNQAIQPYMIRRTKQKVESDLPPKTEKIIRVELSDIQLEYYKNILTRNYAALNAGSKGGQKQSLLNVMMELKKASNHPFMFPQAEEKMIGESSSREEQLRALITSSGKMMLLDQLLTKMKKDNHRVLIFSQMVKMLDILGDYLQLRGHQFQRLDGTIASAARRQSIDHFNAPDSKDFCFILSTRAGGLGINLMTADTVILFDSDWNPQADLQAMARAHRIGQKNPVTIYRLVSKDTVEEEVLERARNKLMLEYITIHRAITDKDAKQINDQLARAGVITAEPSSTDDISRILKRRGQKMFEQSGNQKKLEELDIDAVLANAEEHKTEQDEGITADGGEEFLRNFEYTDVKIDLEWDEIIPKEQLEKLKEEERNKEEQRYLESVIEANAPRKRKAAEESREQRAAKKRARDLAAEAAADVESDAESVTEKDPKRPLSEKEVRNLIRAYERYGSIEERQEEMIKDARLIGRDVDLLKATITEILEISNRMLKDDEDRIRAIERETQKPITKKDKKAILFDYKGVKRLNAETLTERPIEMRMLREIIGTSSEWRNFRVPEATKPAHYTAPWGAREDGMLCVGIKRHGYGAWTAIKEDEELGMSDKFFLEEHRVGVKEERDKADDKNIKSPGAVHLVRRANYLLSVLKDKASNGTNMAAKRALENHHRNNKKNQSYARLHERAGSASGSPAPGRIGKLQREDSQRHRQVERTSVDRRTGAGSPKQHHRKPNGDDDRLKHRRSEDRKVPKVGSPATNGGDSGSTDERMKRLFRPIQDHLVNVNKATRANIPDDTKRLKVIKNHVLKIGSHIKGLVQNGSPKEIEKFW